MSIEKSRYDAVIFDLDGVVTQTAAVHAAAWKRLLRTMPKVGSHRPGFHVSRIISPRHGAAGLSTR